MPMRNKILLSIISLLIIIAPNFTMAAVLYMDPADASFGPGDVYEVAIKLDTGANCINTVEANITFPQDKIKLVDFITGDSIINIWIDKPNSENMEATNQNGLIYLAGGIPGGFCGRIPGDPGYSNLIGKAVFQIPGLAVGGGEPVAKLEFLENSRVFINDGFGTEDKVVFKGAILNISTSPAGTEKKWQSEVNEDKTPPEPFVVELHRNEQMYNNKYYLIFYTTDKQTGMDRYEVIEENPTIEKGFWQKIADKIAGIEETPSKWRVVQIPYVLEDQTLQRVIKVKAVDRAGNEQIVEFVPPETETQTAGDNSQKRLNLILLIITIVIALIIIILVSYKIFRNKENKDAEE